MERCEESVSGGFNNITDLSIYKCTDLTHDSSSRLLLPMHEIFMLELLLVWLRCPAASFLASFVSIICRYFVCPAPFRLNME